LAVELNALETELIELEKSDIPSGYSNENDSKSHLTEVERLRAEMGKILGSEAFESLDSKPNAEELLDVRSQSNV